TFELVALARGVKQSRVNAIFHAQHGVDPDDDPQDDFLRIGVELADGTRVSNLGGRFRRHGHDFNDEPSGPVLVQHGGGGGSGGGGTVTMRPGFWLWPLPPPGAMRIWCEWAGLEVGLGSVEMGASGSRVAAQRAPAGLGGAS